MNALTTMPRPLVGIERAAVLMMLVGEEEAAAILQKLDPEEVRDLGRAMVAVADVGEAEVADVLDDFIGRARQRNTIQFDPRPQVEAVMNRALGPERAESVLARIIPPDASCGLEILEWLDPKEIAAMIEDEPAQIAAVLIANLDPAVAAQVLDLLPEANQPDILHRVARLGPITPEAVETLKAVLAQRSTRKAAPAPITLGGTRGAAKILSSAKKTTEQRVLPKLLKMDKEVGRAIEEAMFVFENLFEMDDKNLGALIRNIDGEVLTKALKGVGEEQRERILGCMSARAADGIRDEMEARGPMKMAEVLDAQKSMIATARALAKDGSISLGGKGGGDDDYV